MVADDSLPSENRLQKRLPPSAAFKGTLIVVITLVAINLGVTFYKLLDSPQTLPDRKMHPNSTWISASSDMLIMDVFSESDQPNADASSLHQLNLNGLTIDFSSLGSALMVRVDEFGSTNGLLITTQLDQAAVIEKVKSLTTDAGWSIEGSIGRVTLGNQHEFTMLFSGKPGDATIALLKERI